jgi:hypothetical protein
MFEYVFDRENISSYNFKIFATDHGEIPNINITNVTVNVMDVNDNGPIFTFPNKRNNTINTGLTSTNCGTWSLSSDTVMTTSALPVSDGEPPSIAKTVK